MKAFAGMVAGLVVAALAAVVVAWSGWYNVAATSSPGKLEKDTAALVVRRSIEKRAGTAANPFPASSENLKTGLAHYKENCLACHGAPGIPKSEFGMGLNPSAPELTVPEVQERSDGQIFWVVSNGIRMTGMPAFSPTHKPEEIWKIVAFVRHMQKLSDDEVKSLKADSGESDHHAESPGEEKNSAAPTSEGAHHHDHSPVGAPHKMK